MMQFDSELFMAIVHLLKSSHDIFVHDKEPGGQLVAFSFEPTERVLRHVRAVVKSVQPFANAHREPFDIMIFTRDGIFDCRSDMAGVTADETPLENPIFAQ